MVAGAGTVRCGHLVLSNLQQVFSVAILGCCVAATQVDESCWLSVIRACGSLPHTSTRPQGASVRPSRLVRR